MLVGNFTLQRGERLFDQAATNSFLLFWRLVGIAQRIGDRHTRDDAIGADGLRDRHNRADMRGGQSRPFQFLDDRCPATRAGASCGGQDNRLDTDIDQLSRNVLAITPCPLHRGRIADGGIIGFA